MKHTQYCNPDRGHRLLNHVPSHLMVLMTQTKSSGLFCIGVGFVSIICRANHLNELTRTAVEDIFWKDIKQLCVIRAPMRLWRLSSSNTWAYCELVRFFALSFILVCSYTSIGDSPFGGPWCERGEPPKQWQAGYWARFQEPFSRDRFVTQSTFWTHPNRICKCSVLAVSNLWRLLNANHNPTLFHW